MSISDPVAGKKPCPVFEAGFLNVASTNNIPLVPAPHWSVRVDYIKANIDKLEEKHGAGGGSIFKMFDENNEPLVLSEEAYQYVNFKYPNDDLRDIIPGTSKKFAADRMGMKPRILVRFNEHKVFDFKLKLIGDVSNVGYSDAEGRRNPDNFKQRLSHDRSYTTNNQGYLIVANEFILGAAGGNKYTIEVEVTSPDYIGIRKQHFYKGILKTARYIWMLPVVGGKGRWVPQYTHRQYMTQTLSTYKDVFIHINYERFPLQNIPELEHLQRNEYDDWKSFIKPNFLKLLSTAKDKSGKSLPTAMRSYIVIALLVRFIYKRTKYTVSGKVKLDKGKHLISLSNAVVEPVKGLSKVYLEKAKGVYRDPNTQLIIRGGMIPRIVGQEIKVVNLRDYTRAVAGFNENNKPVGEGHICCSAFEIDTARLPQAGTMEVEITFYGMKESEKVAGTHWGLADEKSNYQSGFYIFCGQTCRQESTPKKRVVLHNSSLSTISCITSHELGHAVQMVADGLSTRPDKTKMYYDNKTPRSYGEQHLATKGHKGRHCRTGLSQPQSPGATGTCVMFGRANPSNQTFCNFCTLAARKVGLDDPFNR